MFTLGQINKIHERLGRHSSLPRYLQALRAIGITRYDSFIRDGHSEYYGDQPKVISPPVHVQLVVAPVSNREALLKHLQLHNEGKTSYLEMSAALAESGIEKWSFDTNNMTITYSDLSGKALLVENIR